MPATGLADYPPGYLYVLAALGYVWEAFFKAGDSGHFVVLAVLIKLPAIVADACVGILLFAVTRRFASTGWALGVAALYLLNPAVIYNSAAWGQVELGCRGARIAGYLLPAAFGRRYVRSPQLAGRRGMASYRVFAVDQAASCGGTAVHAGVYPCRSGTASFARRCKLDRHRNRIGAGDRPNRAVSSQQSGRSVGMAVAAICFRLERVRLQLGQRVQSVGDSRPTLATGYGADHRVRMALARTAIPVGTCSCSAAR